MSKQISVFSREERAEAGEGVGEEASRRRQRWGWHRKAEEGPGSWMPGEGGRQAEGVARAKAQRWTCLWG